MQSISEWTKAFSTFTSVFIQRPGRESAANERLTNMNKVQSIAEHGLDWSLFNECHQCNRAATADPPSPAMVNQTLHNMIIWK